MNRRGRTRLPAERSGARQSAHHSPARVSTIVGDAARRAGLGRVHAHRLRHTVATELLRAGASLPEIGQLLRHRRVETTAIYAKVDRDSLRLIARPGRRAPDERSASGHCRLSGPCGAPSATRWTRPSGLSASSPPSPRNSAKTHVRTETALAWATLPSDADPIWTSGRLAEVRILARHLRTLDPRTEVPPADLLTARGRRATSYLYTPQEVADLMRATAILRGSHVQATYRTLIGLLAATVMRFGEAIGLDRDDFDTGSGMLTIRHGKFDKSRASPLHPTTATALDDYLRRDDRAADQFDRQTAGLYGRPVDLPIFHMLLHHCGIAPRSSRRHRQSLQRPTPSNLPRHRQSPGLSRRRRPRAPRLRHPRRDRRKMDLRHQAYIKWESQDA